MATDIATARDNGTHLRIFVEIVHIDGTIEDTGPWSSILRAEDMAKNTKRFVAAGDFKSVEIVCRP